MALFEQHASLLIATVAAVGVLHTVVPDHWAPIVVVARQRRWSVGHTARAAAIAGFGHVVSTLILGVVLWAAGAALAERYAHAVSVASAAALVAFGLWIAYGGWKEAREEQQLREHDKGRPQTGLLLILGSSPMIEGLPAFFSASTYGASLLAVMSLVFAAATIVTYVVMSVAGTRSLQHASLGAFERYGELFSGLFVAAVGIYAFATA